MYKIDYYDSDITNMWNEYADKRNIGLKKEANKSLDRLIEYINIFDNATREDFVNYLCNLKFDMDINLTFQHPFVLKVIYPVIINSIKDKKMPQLRWLYQLELYETDVMNEIEEQIGSDSRGAILELANEIDPNDLKTIKLLLDFYFYGLWYGSHHLPEGILMNKTYADEMLEKINNLISKYKNYEIISSEVIEMYNYYNELYSDWFSFHNSEQQITFSEWCSSQGKQYAWVKAYYYIK